MAARAGAVRPPEFSFLPSRATKHKSDYPSDPVGTLAHVGSTIGLLTIGAGGTSDRSFPADAEQACGPKDNLHTVKDISSIEGGTRSAGGIHPHGVPHQQGNLHTVKDISTS